MLGRMICLHIANKDSYEHKQFSAQMQENLGIPIIETFP